MKKIAILSLSLTLAAAAQAQTAEFDYFKYAGMTLASMLKSTRLTSITTPCWLVSIQTHHSAAQATPTIW